MPEKYERPKLISLMPEEWEEPLGTGQGSMITGGCQHGNRDATLCYGGANVGAIGCSTGNRDR